jgi:formate dehydrogenase subunit delta
MPKQIEQLVKMANQIALNLGAGHDEAAAARTAQHLGRFWTPAMRRQLLEFWHAGGAVTPVVASALAALEEANRDRRQTV